MKLYAASTTRNGAVYNNNYDLLPATGFDTETGYNYHIWYPVEIPTGLNSMFKTITTGDVDAVSIHWTPEIGTNGTLAQRQDSFIQERMLLIYNDSNTTINSVTVSITDQQYTGGVMECTEWSAPNRPKKIDYLSFDIKSTIPTNYFPENMYIQANYSNTTPNNTTSGPIVTITNMAPYSWHVAALRLYIVADQEVEEDYCVIATETL
jgi:hypothetical protein